MKIQIASDLHLEFGGSYIVDRIASVKSDVLVLAGDISTHRSITDTLYDMYQCAEKPIVFVPGNHEYYGASRTKTITELKKEFKNHEQIQVLDGDVWVYDGTAFVGATGWCDETYGNVTEEGMRILNDFNRITELQQWKNKHLLMEWGRQDRKFFEKNIQGAGKTVCVSHNGPSGLSIHPKYLEVKPYSYNTTFLNTLFSNSWDTMIERYQPELWVHGHTHDCHDYWIDETRVVCNPRGYYMKEENKDFEHDKVVEI